VKIAHDQILQVLSEIDEDIAAGDQIEPRERRVLDETMGGEYAHIAHLRHRAVGLADFGEPFIEAFRR